MDYSRIEDIRKYLNLSDTAYSDKAIQDIINEVELYALPYESDDPIKKFLHESKLAEGLRRIGERKPIRNR